MSPRMSSRRIDLTSPPLLLASGAFVATEALLFAAFISTPPSPLTALALHLLVTSVFAFALFANAETGDPAAEIVILATAAFTGPAGTLALITGAGLYARRGARPQPTRAGQNGHAAAHALFQKLDDRRTQDLTAPAPPSFHALMTRGTLRERLSVLSVVAAGFHRDHLPVLRQALRNESAAVRAQAAALATTLRLRIKARAAAALALWNTSDADARSGLVSELAYCTRSGFLDPRQTNSIRAALQEPPTLTRAAADARLLAAELAFDAGEYETLAADLGGCLATHTEPMRQIYLACLLRLGRAGEVRRLLREDLRTGSSPAEVVP